MIRHNSQYSPGDVVLLDAPDGSLIRCRLVPDQSTGPRAVEGVWAELIRSARGDRSRAEVSESTGIPVSTLRDWELGKRFAPSWVQPFALEIIQSAGMVQAEQ